MSDLERNLATFQNLCVIASADGKISEGEMTLLADIALSMGLPQKEFWAKILRAPYLDFIIPDTEEEKLRELRMVILMMISDGNITPTEYKGCKRFAQSLDVPEEYLDEIIDMLSTMQEERLKKMAIYGNLYIMAVADGEVSEDEAMFLEDAAASLELEPDEIQHIHSNYQSLELVVPDTEEERYYALRNIVLMMLIDGEIDSQEYKKCLEYAQVAGLSKEVVDEIITEYRQKSEDYKNPPSEVEIDNIDIYLDVYNAFNKINIPPKIMAETMINILIHKNIAYKTLPNKMESKAFYDFLWLICVRAIMLDKETLEVFHEMLAEVVNANSFKAIQNTLLDLEQKYGEENALNLHKMSLREVKESIEDCLKSED